MNVILEVGTKNYDNDLLVIKKSLSHMESLVGRYHGYTLYEPSSKFGWTFFKLAFKSNLQNGIEEKFSDMIQRYPSSDHAEKFANFISDFFISKGCDVKIRISD